MKHISILVPRGAAALSCIEGSFILFSRANEWLKAKGEAPAFEIKLVGINLEAQTYDGLFKVQPELSIADDFKTDLILIPAVNGEMNEVIAANAPLVNWMKQKHQEGAELASMCVGAFILAATGLANGKECSTHWLMAQQFKSMFPLVKMVEGKIICDEQGIYSSGGASSFWNLLLHLLEKYTSRDMAILAAKYFALEIDRNSQASFIIFEGQKHHDDEAIKQAQAYIEANFEEKISIDELADRFALGRRSLERRFKKATSNTVIEYIQRVKVEAAKKSLENNQKTITEVMYEVGYSDTKAFRTVFKNITGLSPTQYKNKYNKPNLAMAS